MFLLSYVVFKWISILASLPLGHSVGIVIMKKSLLQLFCSVTIPFSTCAVHFCNIYIAHICECVFYYAIRSCFFLVYVYSIRRFV